MKLKIIPTEAFKKEIRHLKKKNPKIAESLRELDIALKKGDFGTSMGKGVHKIRVRNVDQKKGKRGGFRVIGYKDEGMGKFYLITMYSKTEKEDIDKKEILELLEDAGILK
jgi:hypothetical protein